MRAEKLVNCIRKKLGQVSGLYSLILYGSLVRGDFIPGTSDVDFFVVLEDGVNPEGVLRNIAPVLEECSNFLNPVEIDVAWEWISNLSDPLRRGYPYKFLTVYERDFRENHVVVIGKDVVGIIPEYSLDELLSERLESILTNLERFRGNQKMLHILAGEIVRLISFLNGSSLRKRDVLRTLERIEDEDAVKIYLTYLNGRKTPFSEDFLVRFIKKRVKEIRESFLP